MEKVFIKQRDREKKKLNHRAKACGSFSLSQTEPSLERHGGRLPSVGVPSSLSLSPFLSGFELRFPYTPRHLDTVVKLLLREEKKEIGCVFYGGFL